MSGSVLERYRNALRSGHVAALRGRTADAVIAYEEAASLVSDRAAPHVGLGRVALADGRPDAALAAFATALRCDPADEAALDGHARSLAVVSRRGPDAADDEALVRDTAALAEAAEEAGDIARLVDAARTFGRADRLGAALDACFSALGSAPTDPDIHRVLAELYRRRGWSEAARHKLELLGRYLAIVDDPADLDVLADAAEERGDVDGLLDVARRHSRQARPAAAFDVCQRALALAPNAPSVHIAFAQLRIDDGERGRAIDGLTLLARVIELTDDGAGRTRLAAFLTREFSARPGLGSVSG